MPCLQACACAATRSAVRALCALARVARLTSSLRHPGRLEALWARLHSARQRVDAIAALSQRARHASYAQLTCSLSHPLASPRLRACSGCRATLRKLALLTMLCSSAPRCARAAWARPLHSAQVLTGRAQQLPHAGASGDVEQATKQPLRPLPPLADDASLVELRRCLVAAQDAASASKVREHALTHSCRSLTTRRAGCASGRAHIRHCCAQRP